MERKTRFIFAVIYLFLLPFVSQAQQIRQLEAVKIPKQIGCISSDPYGFIYLADVAGNIYKIDSLGKQFVLASPPRRGQITSIEAYRNVNIFVFYSEYQVYYYYDRFLNPSQSLTFSQTNIGFARIATPSLDQNVWVVDDQDFSLKKYNSTYLSVDINTPLDLIIDPEQYNMNFMREYQNLLFINDANSGVLIFDNMGNYKTRIPVMGLNYISFSGEDMVFLKDGSLHLINIYTYKERIFTSPVFTDATAAILINNRLYVTTNEMVLINFFKE